MNKASSWRAQDESGAWNFTQEQLEWLREQRSITAKLRERWPSLEVRLRVSGEGELREQERQALGAELAAPGWIREVELRAEGVTLVRARAVTPGWGPNHPWKELEELGTRPLGSVLFGSDLRENARFERTPMEWGWIEGTEGRTSPARRCVFIREGSPLMLMEVFEHPTLFERAPKAEPDRPRR